MSCHVMSYMKKNYERCDDKLMGNKYEKNSLQEKGKETSRLNDFLKRITTAQHQRQQITTRLPSQVPAA